MLPSDVIFAVASPPGRSARGIVRGSGDRIYELFDHHIRDGVERRRGIGPARFDLGDTGARRSVPCLLLTFVAPHSYTGEDSVEIVAPGNPMLLDRIVDALIGSARSRDIDARRAEPGEFTARAFMHGRISLSAAEGVAATIAARCDAQLRAAAQLGSGRLAAGAKRIADDLAEALARVEAGIDFTDQEDVVPIAPPALDRILRRLLGDVTALADRTIGMEALESVPWVVLSGPPNAGKSTLFNALLGSRRAIVSDIAGTTRDVIAEPLTLDTASGPAEVMLVDLAGAATGGSTLDRAMQARARSAIARAELILECVPIDDSLPVTLPATIPATFPATSPATFPRGAIAIRTKADRAPVDDAAPDRLAVSAVTGAGLDALRDTMARRLRERAVSLAADEIVVQPRHEAALAELRAGLADAVDLLAAHRGVRTLPDAELLAATMRSALDALAVLAGEVTPDDILGRVFTSFCVGK